MRSRRVRAQRLLLLLLETDRLEHATVAAASVAAADLQMLREIIVSSHMGRVRRRPSPPSRREARRTYARTPTTHTLQHRRTRAIYLTLLSVLQRTYNILCYDPRTRRR